MGYFVAGMIGRQIPIACFARRYDLHAPIPLVQGLALLPLRDSDLDSFVPLPVSGEVAGFTYLSDQFKSILVENSADEPLMYFEAEYFGGTGSQAAIVFHKHAPSYGPECSNIGPINQALQFLGVKIEAGSRDEFETVGLHIHRSTEDWIELNAVDPDNGG